MGEELSNISKFDSLEVDQFPNRAFIMEDTLFAVLFCGLCMFCLDHLGFWRDVILKTFGANLFTHHFVITYLVNNAAFFPFALFLARYDLRNSRGKVE